mmetsp:Transcript_6280/g.10229  ORF Transcript_6280/g.10229 Transcript_6280/m.10229 type:complete len:275 (+) Transcript_6280:71-895(+)
MLSFLPVLHHIFLQKARKTPLPTFSLRCVLDNNMGKKSFYAVRVGKNGPAIYKSWEKCQPNVIGFPNAIHKGFDNLEAAERFINAPIPSRSRSFTSVEPPSKRSRVDNNDYTSSALPHRSTNTPALTSNSYSEAVYDGPIVDLYADGSCTPNPGKGGWGTVLLFPPGFSDMWVEGMCVELGGYAEYTTNNIMELTALKCGLEHLEKYNVRIRAHLDSLYVKKGLTEWSLKWRRNNWQGVGGSVIKNVDVWKTLIEQAEKMDVKYFWVKVSEYNQ